MKLKEIADRISVHLKAMEKERPTKRWTDDKGKEREMTLYYCATARPAGGRIAISYISYQHTSHLKKADAERYLAWLDAGNKGKHYAITELVNV